MSVRASQWTTTVRAPPPALALAWVFVTSAAIVVPLRRASAAPSDPAPAAGAPKAGRREFNIVPIVGGDSDVGIGFGQVSDWARLEPAYVPFKWRVESGAFITFKYRDSLIIPFQDYYLLLTLPKLGASKRWRLEIRPAYTDETTLKYYGIGNATPLPAAATAETEYGRVHPTLLVQARVAVVPHWFIHFGAIYTHNWLTVDPNSRLAQQSTTGPPPVRAILGDFRSHGVGLAEIGMQYDSRDNEIVTRRGMFHAIQARVSPRVGDSLPYGYVQLNATARFYLAPIPRWLMLSWRVVGDVLVGSPPFYELARFDETPAIGGGKAVRGIPAQRYYGKVKVFQNLEARGELLPFSIKGKHFILGAALFYDAGRVWTELSRRHPELDGTGPGIKYGTGGGLRLQQGETFVVRVDVAWSPDARPIGAYFVAGQIF